MTNYIDLYCERLEPGLWAEPLNAVTNLAFLVAAAAVWKLARRSSRMGADAVILILLLAAIGIGSGLFHTFATHWALLMDELPILLFQLTFIGLYLRRVARLRYYQVAGWLILFIATIYACALLPPAFNGSLGYAPALLALIALGIYHNKTNRKEPKLLLMAAGVFLLSLTFRTIDNAICGHIHFGSHFLWHLLNALLLYLVSRAYLYNR